MKKSDTSILNWMHNRKVSINWLDAEGTVHATLVRSDDEVITVKAISLRGALEKLYFVERELT